MQLVSVPSCTVYSSQWYCVDVQGFIIIRDEDAITSTIKDLAPKFLWEVESHVLDNIKKNSETVLICRKKFWAIV